MTDKRFEQLLHDILDADGENPSRGARLLYVAMTRARQYLFISGTESARNSDTGWYSLVRAAAHAAEGLEDAREVAETEVEVAEVGAGEKLKHGYPANGVALLQQPAAAKGTADRIFEVLRFAFFGLTFSAFAGFAVTTLLFEAFLFLALPL